MKLIYKIIIIIGVLFTLFLYTIGVDSPMYTAVLESA